MKLEKVVIKNFKAIKEANIGLSDFNVILGENGSGKSSVLQALHWMFQSGRNLTVSTNKDSDKGSTLSEKNATYMPSPDYKNSGYGDEYGNFKDAPQMDVSVSAKNSDGELVQCNMWIKAARNEGLSVHIPSNNDFVSTLRDKSKEFSAYIPGLSGIPLLEEKRTKLIVHRQAAAGDANTVLRNVLLRLSELEVRGKSGLKIVEDLVSSVMGKITLEVSFNEGDDQYIIAKFQTEKMKLADPKRFKPLELAGIGFLQVIQIFSYMIYFRPSLLLVDEPDAHLHPSAQEKLVSVLSEAAKNYSIQVILSTHSPSMVRALPVDATVIWMKNGKQHPNGDTDGRQLMGWGLLDKRVLLMTEDTKTPMLRELLSQWRDVERSVALWPLHGSGKLIDAKGCASLEALLGGSMKVVIHRDRDFMMPSEAEAFSKPYQDSNISVWLTQFSDIEAYWCSIPVIKSHFDIDDKLANEILSDAINLARADNKDFEVRNTKRNDIRNKIPECRNGVVGAYSDAEVLNYYHANGEQYSIVGKTLVEKIRGVAQGKGLSGYTGFGKMLPDRLVDEMASDLKSVLENVLAARGNV